jgi:hypothetical protein
VCNTFSQVGLVKRSSPTVTLITLGRANARCFTPVPPETQSKPPPQPRRLSFVEVKVLEHCYTMRKHRTEPTGGRMTYVGIRDNDREHV